MFTTNRYRRRTVVCALALQFAFWIGVVRAGSQDHERIVEVTLTEYQIDMPTVLGAGWTSLKIRNAGKKEHGFKLNGYGLETKLESELKPGHSATLQVDLKPGTYRVACPKDDHDDDKNMKLELRVNP